ncbi:MAG TPA: class I SAM-dependent methyltransferase [bacterium]|nr:class I SAM-dependent methyltransferase [bacterium]
MTNGTFAKPIFDFEAVFEVEDYLYFYSDTLTEEQTDRQVDFLVQEMELNEPMKILDLACGFGRHANRLAGLGHQVTGVDLMPGFLEIAQKDAMERGVEVDYQESDMRYITFNREYDRVLLLFTAFGYFEDAENFKVLENVARALKFGGMLFFDIHNRDVFLKGFLPFIVTEKENDLMIDRNTFDGVSGRLYNRRIVIRDGVRRDKPFFVRLYSPTEIRDLLHVAGLEIYKMYGDWDGHPISTESRRIIIIARKVDKP